MHDYRFPMSLSFQHEFGQKYLSAFNIATAPRSLGSVFLSYMSPAGTRRIVGQHHRFTDKIPKISQEMTWV